MIGFIIYILMGVLFIVLFDADYKEIQSSDDHLTRAISDGNHNPINE